MLNNLIQKTYIFLHNSAVDAPVSLIRTQRTVLDYYNKVPAIRTYHLKGLGNASCESPDQEEDEEGGSEADSRLDTESWSISVRHPFPELENPLTAFLVVLSGFHLVRRVVSIQNLLADCGLLTFKVFETARRLNSTDRQYYERGRLQPCHGKSAFHILMKSTSPHACH